MSLVSICNDVLKEVGWPTYSAIASSTDATAQQIFSIANTELRQLSLAKRWPHLEAVYSFPTVAAQAEYEWPADFDSVAFGGVFDSSEYYQIRGSMNFEDWARLKYGNLNNLSYQKFRTGYASDGTPQIELTPAPDSARDLVALYYTKEYARQSDGTSIAQYVSDDDVSKVPEDLVELGIKWRFRRAKGLDFSAELAEYNNSVMSRFSRYKASQDILIGQRETYDHYGLTEGYVRDNGFG